MEDKRVDRIGKGAFLSGIGTSVSRVSGLIRDILFATCLGTSEGLSTFLMAFTIPNLFRRILGEGAFSEAFIPMFNYKMVKEGEEKSIQYAQRIMGGLIRILILVSALFAWLGLLLAYTLPIRFFFWIQVCENFPFLSIFLLNICLAAFLSGILNSFRRFMVSALAPILMNLGLIAGTLLSVQWKGTYVGWWLGGSVSVAAILEVLALGYWVIRSTGKFQWWSQVDWEEWRELWKKLLPGILGGGIYQLNVLSDRLVAGWVGSSAVAYLYYSERLVYLPVGILGVSFSLAGLPEMSRARAQQDLEGVWRSVGYGLRMMEIIGIPTVLFLWIWGDDLLICLLKRGAFDEQSLQGTLGALKAYAIGIPAFLTTSFLRNVYLSEHDTRTPFLITVWNFFLNLILNIILAPLFGYVGIAAGTSICSYLQSGILLGLRWKDWIKYKSTCWWPIVRVLGMSAVFALIMVGTKWIPLSSPWLRLSLVGLIGACVWVVLGFLFPQSEPALWMKIVFSRIQKKMIKV